MTLNDRKFENYICLYNCLCKAVNEILNKAKNFQSVIEILKQSINSLESVYFIFLTAVDDSAFININNDYSITLKLIEFKSVNEEDPIINNLIINSIEDVFWAKRIVNNTFYSLKRIVNNAFYSSIGIL